MEKTGYDFCFTYFFLFLVVYALKKLGHFLKSVHQFGFSYLHLNGSMLFFFFIFCIFSKLAFRSRSLVELEFDSFLF